MPTKTVATRLSPEVIHRLETIAQIDRRSVAQVIAMLIERGLPVWEEDLERRDLVSRTGSASDRKNDSKRKPA